MALMVALVLLVVGILWLSGASFGDATYSFGILFNEVGGLGLTDKVTVAGLEAGQVSGLTLSNRGSVLADVRIKASIDIPVDSRITVGSYGFLGAKHVNVRPGTSTVYIQPGATVTGTEEKGVNDVLNEMGDALVEIRQVLRSADEILSDAEGKEQIKRTLNKAEDAAGTLNLVISDLRVVASDLKGFIEVKRDPASEAIDSIAEASEMFAEAGVKLDTIAASLDSILIRVASGEGTLGKLINDEQAHDEFIAAIKEVRDLVADIRENPKSFVRFSIF
jgi:phospholipid/cholesterol/gamma-HCH transport system substrate-binding protein